MQGCPVERDMAMHGVRAQRMNPHDIIDRAMRCPRTVKGLAQGGAGIGIADHVYPGCHVPPPRTGMSDI